MGQPSAKLDLRGLVCSEAVIAVHRELTRLPVGARLTVLTDDEALFYDLRVYAIRGGHVLDEPRVLGGGTFEIEVLKGA